MKSKFVLRGARVLGAVALLAMGSWHLEQYKIANFSVVPTIGPLFLLNFVAATILGLLLLIPAPSRFARWRLPIQSLAALAGVGVAAGALVALLISEQTPLFGFMEYGYRIDVVIAIATEVAAISFLGLFVVCARRHVRGARGMTSRREDHIGPAGHSTA